MFQTCGWICCRVDWEGTHFFLDSLVLIDSIFKLLSGKDDTYLESTLSSEKFATFIIIWKSHSEFWNSIHSDLSSFCTWPFPSPPRNFYIFFSLSPGFWDFIIMEGFILFFFDLLCWALDRPFQAYKSLSFKKTFFSFLFFKNLLSFLSEILLFRYGSSWTEQLIAKFLLIVFPLFSIFLLFCCMFWEISFQHWDVYVPTTLFQL